MPLRKIAHALLLVLVWAAANLSPLALVWLLWPRLEPAKTAVACTTATALFNIVLALIFPLQHTVWTQRPIKRRIIAAVGEKWERPLYVLSSAAALIVMAALWRNTDRLVWTLPAAALWPMRAAFVACLALQSYSASLVGPKFLTGLTHLKALRTGEPLRQPEFKERGPYRRVRHPIAMSQVLMLWTAHAVYTDRLILNLMWTAWIILATALEDRRLGAEFGESYTGYRKRAGFLWPRIGKARG